MKKIAIILSAISILTLSTWTMSTTVKADTSSDVTITDTDDSSEVSTVTETRVRVLKDNVSIRKNPLPFSTVIGTANTGDTFKYATHYLGYYLVHYTDDTIGCISDSSDTAEVYTAVVEAE